MMRYPKIKAVGSEENDTIFTTDTDIIVIQEKIDGANFRFRFTTKGLDFGSRTQELVGCTEDNKQWGKCVGYLKRMLAGRNLIKYHRYIFFGECCTPHSTPYDWGRMPPFLGFDIYDTDKKIFLSYRRVLEIYTELGLRVVPLIALYTVQELSAFGWFHKLDDSSVPKSEYYAGQSEGIVFKNYNKQVFAKYVTSKHKERAMKTFGGSKKWATDDTSRLLAVFCTNGRIEKAIYKLRDDGYEIEMPLMKFLPVAVFEDIVEEHYKEILTKNNRVDVGKFRKLIAQRCLHVLKNLIAMRAINK